MTNPEQTDLNASSVPQPTAAQPTQTALPTDPYAAISLPENSLISAADLDTLKQAAAEVNLPLGALQKWVLAEQNRLQTQAEDAAAKQQLEREDWARQTRAQWGPQWQEEVSKAVRAADRFGGPQLRQLLEETGLGNHPVIVRTFHAVATQISEDVAPGGVPGATTDKTFAQALYGKN